MTSSIRNLGKFGQIMENRNKKCIIHTVEIFPAIYMQNDMDNSVMEKIGLEMDVKCSYGLFFDNF